MNIAFDLDGTISDPAIGITLSLNYALDKLGFPQKDTSLLLKYIGPPLNEIFEDLLGKSDKERIKSAITLYRERYFSCGYRENVIYPEIEAALKELSSNDNNLFIATSKRTDIAKSVTEYFGITHYFKDILGCGLKRKKDELLSEIKKRECTDSLIMVGDRSHDVVAGKATQCFCIGVLWGYGSKKELLDSGADVLLNKPNELAKCIMTGAQPIAKRCKGKPVRS